MDENGFYPAAQRDCPSCQSDDVEMAIDYGEAQGWESPGAGGFADMRCNECGHLWIRGIDEEDFPDEY